jgi:hypothetical protein
MQEMFSILRSWTICWAGAGRLRKSLKIKITGKTAGGHLMGRGNPVKVAESCVRSCNSVNKLFYGGVIEKTARTHLAINHVFLKGDYRRR